MIPPRFLNKTTPPHLFTLVIATATGALTMNIFLPSLPAIAKHYQADYAVVQLIVSLYLAATGTLQLFIGPASDRYGRRPVMLTCFVVFILGSIGALFAPTIETLLAARILQAFSASGMVLSRAIVRDTVSTDEAASRIGYITMGMSVVPMIGPFIGGLLDEYYGWQASFLLILLFGTLAFALIYLDLGETNKNRSAHVGGQFRSYLELVRSADFWCYTLTGGFASGCFFAFLGGGPYVATVMLGLSPSQYGMYFALMSVGYMAGNFVSGRFSRDVGINRMMLAGNIVTALGIFIALAFIFAGIFTPLSFFAPIAMIGIGNGMALPNANAGIVSVRPRLAGAASGLGGALQIGAGAGMASLAGALLSPTSGPVPLLIVMSVSAVGALFPTLYLLRQVRPSDQS